MPSIGDPRCRTPAAALIAVALAGCGGSHPAERRPATPSASPTPVATTIPSPAASPTPAPTAASTPTPQTSATAPVNTPIYGVDLGIHVLSGAGSNDAVPDSEIVRLLRVLQGHTQWVRVYNVMAPWQNAPRLAHEMGFKVAATAYLGGQPEGDEAAINRLVDDVNRGYVDYALAGSEAVIIKAITPAQEVAYIQELKQKVGGRVPVGTAEPHTVLLAHPEIMRACDIVLANIAPISYAVPLNQSMAFITSNYSRLVSLAGGVEVGIGETNWPSSGFGSSPAQEATYVRQFETWARSHKLRAFYFEAFDEPYLGQYNEVGPHWGLWTSGLQLKPGLAAVFTGGSG